MRQLIPVFKADANLGEAYGVVRHRHKTGRPTIGLCMVMSIDGSTVVEGRSTLLSNPTDRDVMIALRAVAETIVVGAGTIREQMYTPPSKKGLRVGVVTRTANLDFESPLFRGGSGFLIMPEDAPKPECGYEVEIIRAGQGDVDLHQAMSRLPGNFVQLEGGPMLNASMFDANLIDEINLTISPMVTGANSPRLSNGAPALHRDYEVAHILEQDGFLFIRYVRKNDRQDI